MNLNFLSGLLLAAVTFAIVFFVVKELIDDSGGGDGKKPRASGRFLERFSGGEAKPVNEHLIGALGKVISHSGDSARPIRVEVGRESWPARLSSTETDQFPVGETVRVLEVHGAVLVVEASDESSGQSNTS